MMVSADKWGGRSFQPTTKEQQNPETFHVSPLFRSLCWYPALTQTLLLSVVSLTPSNHHRLAFILFSTANGHLWSRKNYVLLFLYQDHA